MESDWPFPDHDVLGEQPDPLAPPPPDVWEFYRRHGRWPEPEEA